MLTKTSYQVTYTQDTKPEVESLPDGAQVKKITTSTNEVRISGYSTFQNGDVQVTVTETDVHFDVILRDGTRKWVAVNQKLNREKLENLIKLVGGLEIIEDRDGDFWYSVGLDAYNMAGCLDDNPKTRAEIEREHGIQTAHPWGRS